MTCDNASNNDAMIEELQEIVPEFAGSASHTCCFLHIVNLITKSLIRQFDAGKMTAEGDHELAELRRELKEEANYQGSADSDEAEKEVDNDEGWVDKMENMTDEEKTKLETSIQPVKLALVKVRGLVNLYIPLNLIGSDPQSCLQDHPLDDQGTPSLE